ncbi:MAG: zinc ribbon domain-containing protein [Dehalococcoidales bacterium]|jgi:putative FmdB family regulatory protein|nr:zinc ribbon domain-containing protein [Dehalococcoidales bacterium]MDD4229892.1 zinc ribbon domain-containing protein [Dehalococcoidales bacterium]MDD4465575.1 zinc ribbon domain-containing protein [Dehalococcoidales bacterium]MDD5402034.1 zinc ribbon domain-containing protein [Dehalococcoidales bacterium]
MPTYTYGCKKCGIEFEIFKPMDNAEDEECPICGSKEIERVYSSFNYTCDHSCGSSSFG